MQSPWTPGFVVDGYLLERELGAGGMGVVYQVVHGASGVRYALKTLDADADPELVQRFEREGQAQARVDGHPNVVRIHSAGHCAGRAYLVMELAGGGDLSARLRNGPLPAEEAARIVCDLARGLAHVHARGVLHRDLKPENVLFGDDGTPKLVDFGLATLPGADALTRSTDVMGTPGYMAPEQALGKASELDARTDVYGLGAVLYAALTGRPPFEGNGLFAILAKVTDHPPTPPSELANVPAELEAVCLGALSKDPAARPQSATDLAFALDHALAGGPAVGGRGPVVLLAVAAAVLLLGLGLWFALQPPAAGPGALDDPPPPDPPSSSTIPAPVPTPAKVLKPNRILAMKGLAGFRACEAYLEANPQGTSAGSIRKHRRELMRGPLFSTKHPGVVQGKFTQDGRAIVSRTAKHERDLSSVLVSPLNGSPPVKWTNQFMSDVVVDTQAKLIVTSGDTERLDLFRYPTGEPQPDRWWPGEVKLHHLVLDRKRKILISGGIGPFATFRWPELEPLELLLETGLAGRSVQHMALDGLGRLHVLARIPGNNYTYMLTFETLDEPPTEQDVGAGGTKVAGSPVDGRVAVGFGNGDLLVRQEDGVLLRCGSLLNFAHSNKVAGLVFSPDGRWLYSSTASPEPTSNQIRRWRTGERTPGPRVVPGGPGEFVFLDISADGKLLLVTLRGKGSEVWAVDGLWKD